MFVTSVPRYYLNFFSLASTLAVAGGTRWRVAKQARLIAVKPLSDSGSGLITDMYALAQLILLVTCLTCSHFRISAINWSVQNAHSSGRPSVITLSLGAPGNVPLDNAVIAVSETSYPIASL